MSKHHTSDPRNHVRHPDWCSRQHCELDLHPETGEVATVCHRERPDCWSTRDADIALQLQVGDELAFPDEHPEAELALYVRSATVAQWAQVYLNGDEVRQLVAALTAHLDRAELDDPGRFLRRGRAA